MNQHEAIYTRKKVPKQYSILRHVESIPDLKREVAKYIVKHSHAHTDVEDPYFRKFSKVGSQMSAKECKKIIHQIFEEMLKKFQNWHY